MSNISGNQCMGDVDHGKFFDAFLQYFIAAGRTLECPVQVFSICGSQGVGDAGFGKAFVAFICRCIADGRARTCSMLLFGSGGNQGMDVVDYGLTLEVFHAGVLHWQQPGHGRRQVWYGPQHLPASVGLQTKFRGEAVFVLGRVLASSSSSGPKAARSSAQFCPPGSRGGLQILEDIIFAAFVCVSADVVVVFSLL